MLPVFPVEGGRGGEGEGNAEDADDDELVVVVVVVKEEEEVGFVEVGVGCQFISTWRGGKS